ncbi:MAG: sulfotransferase [Burkholderiales bacterium]|nr:sulfotransferase [Burkholderiales bacterium]
MSSASDRFLIICGAEKAGTTSLYGYLATHPNVRPSIRKETDYFRSPHATLAGYRACFVMPEREGALCVESSPAYLAEAADVAPRLAAVVPQAHLVFILRDPVDRLRSAYRFYQSRLHVPADMDFGRFVSACLDAESGVFNPDIDRLKPWHQLAAARGRYERLLSAFDTHFAAAQRLLVPHAQLQSDPAWTTRAVARFAGLDPAHFQNTGFARENVSFAVRNRRIQRVAVKVNDSLEGLWRRYPELKRRLLSTYKRFNAKSLQEDALPTAVQERLDQYYQPTRQYMAAVARASAAPASHPPKPVAE